MNLKAKRKRTKDNKYMVSKMTIGSNWLPNMIQAMFKIKV